MPDFAHEIKLAALYGPSIAGIDEAGRGPWAGPVVAAVVCVRDQARFMREFAPVTDSKQLQRVKRETLADALMAAPFIEYGVGEASVEEVDRVNILQATFLAVARAAQHVRAAAFIMDGNRAPDLAAPVITLVGGDRKSYSVAAASILAKVARDRAMKALAKQYPEYGWERNAGYGTAEHREALAHYGITPAHRRSYAPIRALLSHPYRALGHAKYL